MILAGLGGGFGLRGCGLRRLEDSKAEELALLAGLLEGWGADERNQRDGTGLRLGHRRRFFDRWRDGTATAIGAAAAAVGGRVFRRRLDCRRLLEAVRAAVVGAESKTIMRPRDGGTVNLKPGDSEDHRVVTEAHGVKLDVFDVGSDLELDWSGLVGDGDGTSIGEHQVSRLSLEAERDSMGLGKRDIDEGTGSARVDHCLRGD